jgi:HIRAN domain
MQTTNNFQQGKDSVQRLVLVDTLSTAIAGYLYYNAVAIAADPIQLVREPDNPADANAIAVLNLYGQKLGFVNRGIAAEYAALIDHGYIRLTGRLVAPEEPGYDADRAVINPPLEIRVYADQVRLDDLERQSA